MRLESIESLCPLSAEWLEPLVDLAQGDRIDFVPATLPVGTNPHQICIAHDAEVLRHRRLTEPDPLGECADRLGASAQFGQQLPSAGFCQHCECIHPAIMRVQKYNC